MKHVSKALLLTLVLSLTVSILAACSGTTGLVKGSEALGSPETVARNKEPYSTTLIPYASVEQALGGDYTASPYYKSMNGTWDFAAVISPKYIPAGYEKADYGYSYADNPTVRKNDEEPITWGTITVPSNWEMAGYDYVDYSYNTYPWGDLVAPNVSDSYNPVGLYRNLLNVPADWDGRQVYISFEGVASCVYVYVNGALVGYAEDSYTGKTFNITDAVKFGADNLVVLEVYKYCDGSYLEATDSLKFGGVYRDVYVYSAPETQIRDFTYDMQMSGEDALMNVTVALASYSKPSDELSVELSVYDANGNAILPATRVGDGVNFSAKPVSSANAYTGEVGSRISVPSPKLWSAETPNLYTVVLELKDGDDVIDTVSKRIGFKTVGVELDDNGVQSFVINGKVVTLRGVLYNENSPVNGMAVTREEMISDIKQMKELNVNAVRSPGRPLSEEFISLCDEYGLYVIDDVSLNSNPYSNKDELSIPGDQTVWQNACLDRLLNVVYRDKNSASVIMWSIGSDSGMGSNFSVMRNWLTSADSRMIIYDDDSSASDLVIGANLALNDLYQLLNDSGNKKAILFQDTRGGLLNNGGNFTAYSKLMNEYASFQGGFFAYWADNAIFYPVNAADAANTLRNSPYNAENAALYRLTYPGDMADGYISLSGILTADRKSQSDAVEFRNAFAPVYVDVVDASKGVFAVYNRDAFAAINENYVLTYEVTDGTKVIKTGTLSDLKVAPGASDTFTVEYGTTDLDGCYIYFTVKYKNAPAWADDNDFEVFAKQYSLVEKASLNKDGSVQQHTGTINLSVYQAPEIKTDGVTFASGKVYVTNRSQANFNDLYTLSWIIYEQHPYWETKRWVVYDEGKMDAFDVPAGSVNLPVTIPVNTTGAVSGGSYVAHIILTSKVDMADVPAGSQIVFSVNGSGYDNIPFTPDPIRKPVVVGEAANGDAIMGPADVDKEPEVDEEKDLFEVPVPESYTGSSVITLSNDKLSLKIDANTGLISQYAVDGKDIFVPGNGTNASMLANLYRNPTGGDIISSAVTTSVQTALKNLSQNNTTTKFLVDGYKLTQVAANHYRIEMEFLWVTYPLKTMRSFNYDTKYVVVYDVYSDGEIQVSVKYEPTVTATAPLELSSVMNLTTEFKTMSWFGLGAGETYSDKVGDSRVGLYEDVSIVDQLGKDYIYSTGAGDKTQLQWVALERADGSGIVITSDSDLFSVNVSKDYPWTSNTYAPSSAVSAAKTTILRVIGQQRGVSANTLFDEEYSDAQYIVPGVNYVYSFRIVPVSAGYDADKISKTVLNSGSQLETEKTLTLDNNSFALTNAASSSTYLSGNAQDGIVSILAALGNDSQVWIKEAANDINVSEAFRIKSFSAGLYLSPVSRDASGVPPTEAEITLAPYYNNKWQNWTYDKDQLFSVEYNSGNGLCALYIAGATDFKNIGVRMALKAARSDAQSKWTLIFDSNDTSKMQIRSALSGKYLTVVDQLTYSNPLVESRAFRLRNFSNRANWNSYVSFTLYPQYTEANRDCWVGDGQYVTMWDLLPADSQMWTFVPVNGGYNIINKESGKALTVVDGVLSEQAKNNAASQVWSVVACDGMYGIVNTASNMALTLRSVNGQTVLMVQEWEELAIQMWNFASEDDLKVNVEAGDNWY